LVGLMTITPEAFSARVHLVVERARAKEPAASAGHTQRKRPVDPQPGGLHADGRVSTVSLAIPQR
jgi:hypothetical protein